MTEKFKVQFLEEAAEFLDNLDEKTREKIIYNITHGLLKKTGKTPQSDLEKAERIRSTYFQKNRQK